MSSRLLSFDELKTKKGITASKATIRRGERAGTFPRHVHPTPGTNAWFEHEIDQHLDRLAAARDGGEPCR